MKNFTPYKMQKWRKRDDLVMAIALQNPIPKLLNFCVCNKILCSNSLLKKKRTEFLEQYFGATYESVSLNDPNKVNKIRY